MRLESCEPVLLPGVPPLVTAATSEIGLEALAFLLRKNIMAPARVWPVVFDYIIQAAMEKITNYGFDILGDSVSPQFKREGKISLCYQ